MGVLSLVKKKVLSRLMRAAGVLVVVVGGLEAFCGFLEATLAQVFWGGAEGGGTRLEDPEEGGGGAADWRVSPVLRLCW